MTKASAAICSGAVLGASLFLVQTPMPAKQFVPSVPAKPEAVASDASTVTYEMTWQKTIDVAGPVQIVVGKSHIIMAGDNLAVRAMSVTDGTEVWTKELLSEVRVATGDGMVFVASGSRLHALDETTGMERWNVAIDITNGPSWTKGIVVLSAGPELMAIRSTDGSEVWRQHIGWDSARSVALDKARVFAALQNRSVVVLDLVTGVVQGHIVLSAKPGDLAVAGGRVYFGADNGCVYAYQLNRREASWVFEIRVPAVGGPVIDDRCVYMTFMDNSVRAFRRGSGSHCWSPQALNGRPAGSPLLSESHLIIPLTSGELVVLRTKDGRRVNTHSSAAVSGQRVTATLQAIAAPADLSVVYMVLIGDDQRRVLTALKRSVK